VGVLQVLVPDLGECVESLVCLLGLAFDLLLCLEQAVPEHGAVDTNPPQHMFQGIGHVARHVPHILQQLLGAGTLRDVP